MCVCGGGGRCELGTRTLCRACQDLICGVPPPPNFNHSLVVYSPKKLGQNTPGVPLAHDSRMRPITLSNTSHTLGESDQRGARAGGRGDRSSSIARLHAGARQDDQSL